MANEVDICNGALTKIGSDQINSLEDDKKAAIKCKLRYPVCRDFVLRTHPWKSIRARQALNAMTTIPAFEWEKQFTLPENLLRLWLVTDVRGNPLRRFEKEGNLLLCDYDTVYIKYGKNVTDATQYDSMLIEAISYYLAADICYSLTQDVNVLSSMEAGYNRTIRLAKSVDAQEDRPKKINANKWEASRRRSNDETRTRFPQLR